MTITLPDLAVFLLDEDNSMTPSSLSSLRGDKAMVIDFWHTKCTRCPAALEKLNGEAGKSKDADVIFISCALSQGEGNHETAADLVADGSLEHMTHVFMDLDIKEQAKAAFGYTSVPFYVVVDKAGNVVGSGEPKTVDYKNLLQEANTAAVNLQENSTTLPDMNKAVDGEINSKDSKNNFTLDEDF